MGAREAELAGLTASVEPTPAPPGRWSRLRRYPVLATALGAVCGLSPFWRGFYDIRTWGVVAFLALVALTAVAFRSPRVPRGPGLAVLGGLAGLAAWSWISAGWAESGDQAVVSADHWALYAALFAIALLALRGDRNRAWLLGGVAGGVLVVAAVVLVKLLAGDSGIFLSGRLNDPLGYVNGQAAYFLAVFWSLVAVAEGAARRSVSAAAVGGAVALAALMVLSETRAIIPGVVVSGLVLLTLVPGRRRRFWVVLAVGAGLGVLALPLTHVYTRAPGGASTPPSTGSLRGAGLLILVVSAAVGLGWAVASAQVGRLLQRRPDHAPRLRRLETRLIAGLGIATLVLLLVFSGHIRTTARSQYDAFVHLGASQGAATSNSRFLSGGGNRYDYWRIALGQFGDHPFKGLGAGGYDRTYFLQRRTTEDVRQPHSIELQTLAELGLVGAAALALFLGGVLRGLARRVRAARADPLQRGLTVAAAGAFLGWFMHTSVDWLHLIPGVTAIALCAAAVLVGTAEDEPAVEWGGAGRLRAPLAAAGILAVFFAGLMTARPTIAEYLRNSARSHLASDPSRALRSANDSLRLYESVPTYYVKGAALARLGDYAGARGALLAARRAEPHDFVTWALLGDLAVRAGRLDLAGRYYRRASALNPREPELARLARNPRAALGQAGS